MLLFSNGKSADDRAVQAALKRVDRWDGRVFAHTAPLKQISRYGRIARGVSVEQSPTVVIADRNLQAETLVGYVDRRTIDQSVVDALRNTNGMFTSSYLRSVDKLCVECGNKAKAIPHYYAAGATKAQSDRRLTRYHALATEFTAEFAAIKAPKKFAAFRAASIADDRAGLAALATYSAAVTPKSSSRRQHLSANQRYATTVAADRQALRRRAPTRWVCTAAARSSDPHLDSLLVEAFREHLEHPAGRGLRPPGAHDGAAGGAACGDLSGSRCASTATASPPPASTPPAAAPRRRPARPPSTLVEGARVLDAARVGAARDRRRAGRALAGQVPRRRPRRRRAAPRARRRRARRRRAARPTPGRTLVAMSGGVDSAVAALLVRATDAVAVTLELWADPENDAEASCCSAHAVRARPLGRAPDGPAALHARPARGVPRRRRRPVPGRPRRRRARRTRASRCNGHVRLDAMLEFADRLGAAALATGHYARPTRRRAAARAPPTRPRTRPTCSPPSRRRRSRGCASRSAS